MTVCKHVYFWGKVQGVGFRYTTAALATHFPVTGFVKNMLDGQVEVVAEGEPEDVDRFLQAVEGQMAGYIRGQTAQDEVPRGLSGFEIRS